MCLFVCVSTLCVQPLLFSKSLSMTDHSILIISADLFFPYFFLIVECMLKYMGFIVLVF